MTALACALAFGFALAFAGWVLWLRERRGETVEKALFDLGYRFEAIEGLTADLPKLQATVSDLAMKAGLTRK